MWSISGSARPARQRPIAPTQFGTHKPVRGEGSGMMRGEYGSVRRLALAFSVLMLVVVASDAAAARRPPSNHLRVRGGRIEDGAGRTVLMRGVNVNQLGDYFAANPAVPPTLPFSRTDLERIAALGLNTVRLLVHWSRLEPEPGTYSEAYLGEISQAVEWARELGIYVVLEIGRAHE